MQITILPPFWATGWAIALYIIAGILLAYGVIRFIFRIQQKKLEEEQERATVRQQHEVDEMKLRFFTNVANIDHDSFGEVDENGERHGIPANIEVDLSERRPVA